MSGGADDALKGHAFAWRMEENEVHVVIVAASAERGDSGKLERIYPKRNRSRASTTRSTAP